MTSGNLDKKNLRRVKKLFITLFLIFAAIGVLVYSISNTIEKQRKLPSLHTTKKDLSVRGDILSSDNFKISTSKKYIQQV